QRERVVRGALEREAPQGSGLRRAIDFQVAAPDALQRLALVVGPLEVIAHVVPKHLAAFRAPLHRLCWHYFFLEAFFSGNDLGDFVAPTNSAPTDFGMPRVLLPLLAAAIARN